MKVALLKPVIFLVCSLLVLTETVIAKTIDIKPMHTIEAPRKYIPGVEDKAGYWIDYGITLAFDFTEVTNTLAAVIQQSNGPTRLYLYNFDSGTIRSIAIVSQSSQFSITRIAFSPDGTRVAIPTGTEHKLTIWNAKTGNKEAEGSTDGDVTDVAWAPDGGTIAVVAGKDIEIWNAHPLVRQRFVHGARSNLEWPMSVGWSPDGHYLAIGTNSSAIYIAKGGEAQSPSLKPSPKGSIYLVDWNHNGTLLAAAGFGAGSSIAVWKNAETAVDSPFEKKYQLTTMVEPSKNTWWTKMTWEPSGRVLAFGSSDKKFVFCDPLTGTILRTFVPHNSIPIEAHWHGKYLVTVGNYPDKNFKVWGVRVNEDVALPLAPSPTVIEAESLLASAVVSAGNASRQEMAGFGSGWSGGEQLFWRPPAPVNTPIRNWPNLRLFHQVSKAGRYRVTLAYTVAPDYGKVRVFVRGQPVKDFDGYAPSVLPRRQVLGEFDLGTNRFEMLFTVFSKNSASSNYFVGLDYIELQPID